MIEYYIREAFSRLFYLTRTDITFDPIRTDHGYSISWSVNPYAVKNGKFLTELIFDELDKADVIAEIKNWLVDHLGLSASSIYIIPHYQTIIINEV